MSDQQQQFTADDLKAAILAALPPELTASGHAEPGKYAATFDPAKFQRVIQIIDNVIEPIAPIVGTFVGPQWQALILMGVAAVHAAAGGTLAHAPAEAEPGVHVIANH